MTQTPPDEPTERAITVRLTRETIILTAALMFLGLAVLLAVLFPPSGSTPVSVVGTASPQTAIIPGATSVGEQPVATVVPGQPGGYPSPDGNGNYPAPGGDAVGTLPTAVFTPFPEPGEDTGEEPTAAQPEPFNPTVTTPETGYPGPATQPTLPPFATPQPTEDPLFEPDDDATAVSQPTPQPTVNRQPTAPPQPTADNGNGDDGQTDVPTPTRPRPTARPTDEPAGGVDGGGTIIIPTVGTAPPAALPVTVISGNVRWTADQSPIVVTNDTQITRGSTLTIDPGVEVRVAPGVSMVVEGTMFARGEAGRPVRFVSLDRQRWDGLYGRGGTIILEQTQISGGGNGGTLIATEGGALTLRGAQVRDNGGQIRTADTTLDVRDTDISGNDMPYGAALEAGYSRGGGATVIGTRIGGNRLANGASALQLNNTSPFDTLNLDVRGNLLTTETGPNLGLRADGPLLGNVACNALMNGTNGLSLLSGAPQVPGFALTVRDNAIEDHIPPVIPEYLKYGIGRGATSAIALDMSNNWWGSELGPYEPDQHADGRGDSPGVNITFSPWLTARPACAPTRP